MAAFLEFFTNLPWYLRLAVSVAMLAVGGYMVYDSWHTAKTETAEWAKDQSPIKTEKGGRFQMVAGSVLLVLGAVCLLVGEKSDAEKNGYKF
jgi:ABC-type phosphate transport system permease subunit